MFKLFCIFVILNFLIYSSRKTLYIPGVTINSANNEKYYGLPNEVPALSSIFEKIKTLNPNKYEIIQSLSNIIGLFPLPEQYALYKSVISSIYKDDIFNYIEYYNFMFKDYKYFNKQIDSLNEYLTEEENRKILSLGAIKKVMAQFGFNSFDDENITIKIEENINEILNAQKKLDICENNFLKKLFEVFILRRNFLFDINMNNYNKNDEKKFLRDENKNYTIKGFYYNKDQSENIIKSFKTFAFCHHYYNNILNYNAILTQIYIGQLDKCSEVEETNEFSGNSSNKVTKTEEFKGDNKIGVNVYDNVRYDRKTLNNYYLNYGFRLGKEYKKIDKSDKPYRFNISYEWETKIQKIEKIINKIEDTNINKFEDLFNFLDDNDDDDKDYRPFVNLARFLVDTIFNDDSSKKNFDLEILQNYEQNKSLDDKLIDKFIFINDTYINTDEFKMNNKNEDNSFNSFKILIYFTKLNEKLMVVEAFDKETKKNYFDLYWNGENYATNFYNTITACFAAFSSLGKDDKDACRGVLTKKCGRELDYRCKESGFYDVILQNPVADNILPQNCLEILKNNTKLIYNDNACLKWLEVYLIKNGLIIKPSAMGSFSLLMQSASKGYDSINTRLMSVFGDKENPIPEESVQIKTGTYFMPDPEKLKKFNIQNINSESDSDSELINKLMSQVDKTFYLQIDHSNNIKFSYIFLLLILFLFN